MSARKPCATGSAASRRAPLRRATLAPRNACSSGMIHACAKLASATGAASGWTQIRTTPAAMNGIVSATVQTVHKRAQRSRRAASIGGRHGTLASSGSATLRLAHAGAVPRPDRLVVAALDLLDGIRVGGHRALDDLLELVATRLCQATLRDDRRRVAALVDEHREHLLRSVARHLAGADH